MYNLSTLGTSRVIVREMNISQNEPILESHEEYCCCYITFHSPHFEKLYLHSFLAMDINPDIF